MTGSGLRILCLHGYRQNEQFFREKTGSMRKALKKHVEFVFISAPHVPSVSSEDRGEVRGWWFSRPDAHFSSRDVTDIATGFDESVNYVLQFIIDHGPFDGILGFSQGASMTDLLLAKAKLGEIVLPIRFGILASGFISLSSQHSKYADVTIEIPVLHIFGTGDEVVFSSTSEKLLAKYVNATSIVHQGGHFIPPISKYKEQIISFLEQQS